MALDDKEKRAAVLGVARPWMRDKFPVATPDAEWRISSGNAYGAYIGVTAPIIGERRQRQIAALKGSMRQRSQRHHGTPRRTRRR